MALERNWDQEPLTILCLSPRCRQCLAQHGIDSVGLLCRLALDDLADRQSWMSVDELRDRRFAAEWIFREIQAELARFGLAMRGGESLELAGQPLSVLGLSLRAGHHAKRRGITTVGQLCTLTEEDVLVWGGFSDTTLREVREALGRVGLRLRYLWEK